MNYKLCPHVNYYLLPLQINAPQAESSALADEQEDRLAPMDMGMGEAFMLDPEPVEMEIGRPIASPTYHIVREGSQKGKDVLVESDK